MNDFKCTYSPDDGNGAVLKLKKTVALYVAVCIVFAILCVGFVLLYKLVGVNLYICAAINIVVTIAFIWFSCLFFSCYLRGVKLRAAFFKQLIRADTSLLRGKYIGIKEDEVRNSLTFSGLSFLTDNGERKLIVLKGTYVAFKEGREYDLMTAGNRLIGYKEVNDDV